MNSISIQILILHLLQASHQATLFGNRQKKMGSLPSSNRTQDDHHMNNSYSLRRARHAGSWYSAAKNELDQTLQGFLSNVEDNDLIRGDSDTKLNPLRAIICPHAGFSYSGPTAAWSFKALSHELAKNSNSIQTILILHPSHHAYLEGCAVSGASSIETPLGNLIVDDDIRQEILALNDNHPKSKFTVMTQEVDEREHSGEMQYPFIQKCLCCDNNSNKKNIRVLPIMCGALSTAQEERYGKILSPIIRRPQVLCVISSDFCHWGNRFQYQPTPSNTSTQQIFEYIKELDRIGMDKIELQEPGAFAKYLKETRNTICGRHAISVWLNAVHTNKESNEESLDIAFVRYAQSSPVNSLRDSSVSYASAVARRRKA